MHVVEAIFASKMEDVISSASQCLPQCTCTKMWGAPSVGNNRVMLVWLEVGHWVLWKISMQQGVCAQGRGKDVRNGAQWQALAWELNAVDSMQLPMPVQ